MTGNGWLRMIAENPGHSDWYIERFRSMAASGHDLDGEAAPIGHRAHHLVLQVLHQRAR